MYKIFSLFLLLTIFGVSWGQLLKCEAFVPDNYRVTGKRALAGADLMNAAKELRIVLVKLSESDGPFYRVGLILGASEQLVAGSLKTVAVQLLDYGGLKHNCEVDLWTRPWLTDGTEVTIRCECMRTVFKHVEYD